MTCPLTILLTHLLKLLCFLNEFFRQNAPNDSTGELSSTERRNNSKNSKAWLFSLSSRQTFQEILQLEVKAFLPYTKRHRTHHRCFQSCMPCSLNKGCPGKAIPMFSKPWLTEQQCSHQRASYRDNLTLSLLQSLTLKQAGILPHQSSASATGWNHFLLQDKSSTEPATWEPSGSGFCLPDPLARFLLRLCCIRWLCCFLHVIFLPIFFLGPVQMPPPPEAVTLMASRATPWILHSSLGFFPPS